MPQQNQPPMENRGGHPIDIVPPTTQPMTMDLDHPSYGNDVPFWTPTLADTIRHLGWRWIMFAPALAVVIVVLAWPWYYRYTTLVFIGGGKLLLFCIGLAVATAGSAIKSATRERTDPFCIHCGYDLTGLSEDHLCPECGRPFSLTLIDEYRRDPNWFVQRCKARMRPLRADVPFMAGPVRRKKSRDGT